jgi:DNA-binding CsgD family transcriptional regulator
MLQCADRFDEARENLVLVRRHALACGDESALPWVLMRLSHVELHAGDWDAALRYADEAHAEVLQTRQEAQAGVVLCTRALVLAHLGRADETRAAAEEGLARAEQHDDGIALRIGRFALGHLALALGDTSECVAVLEELWDDTRAAGNVEPGENRFLGDLCEALVGAGQLGRAAEVAAELELRGTELGRPAGLAVAARCRGQLAAARGDREAAIGELEVALLLHDRVLLPFQRARTLLALGAVQRAARHRRDARMNLEEARASFAALGAQLWQGRAEDELGRIGGRAPSAGALTGAERRVATLVATGRTNREVAAELVLAERTVESHLSHIYRKLGVRSRAELAHRLKVP